MGRLREVDLVCRGDVLDGTISGARSPTHWLSSTATSPSPMTTRIDNRSSPLPGCADVSASCMAIADFAAAVTLGNSNQ